MNVRLSTDLRGRKADLARHQGKGTTSSPVGLEAQDRTPSPFEQILNEVLPAGGPSTGDLHQFWQDLPWAERSLLDHPSEENLQNYRRIVLGIARETLRANTRLRKITRRNRAGEELQLTVVEFIDERLQRMANMIHSKRNSAFQLLKTVEEIRGVLFDARE